MNQSKRDLIDQLIEDAKDLELDCVEELEALRDRACPKPAYVSVWGLYEDHTTTKIKANSVAGLVSEWLRICAEEQYSEFGAPDLCPAIVIDSDGHEVRRVGSMVSVAISRVSKLVAYIRELESDPDIPRLLAEYT